MKTLVLGANGQLGSDLVEEFRRNGDAVVPAMHADVVVEDPESIRSMLARVRPDVVLNTAAFHHLPKCEESPMRAFEVNALGALNVAKACDDLDITAVYFSTDYVFDGMKSEPYVESDATRPLNVYGASKLAGEHLTLAYCRKPLVLRISGIYGRTPCRAKGGNFVTTMIRRAREDTEVRVVSDEVLTPTPTADIARWTHRILHAGATGLYHLTCEGECSWYEFAKEIFRVLELGTPLLPLSSSSATGVKRPTYSVLENRNLKAMGLGSLPHWREALASYLDSTYRS